MTARSAGGLASSLNHTNRVLEVYTRLLHECSWMSLEGRTRVQQWRKQGEMSRFFTFLVSPSEHVTRVCTLFEESGVSFKSTSDLVLLSDEDWPLDESRAPPTNHEWCGPGSRAPFPPRSFQRFLLLFVSKYHSPLRTSLPVVVCRCFGSGWCTPVGRLLPRRTVRKPGKGCVYHIVDNTNITVWCTTELVTPMILWIKIVFPHGFSSWKYWVYSVLWNSQALSAIPG